MRKKAWDYRYMRHINGDMFFYFGYGILLVVGTLSRSFYAGYIMSKMTIIYLVAWSMIAIPECIYFLKGKYEKKDWAGVLICGGLFLLLIRFKADAIELATFLPLTYVARKYDFKRVVRFSVWIQGIVFVGIVLSAFSGKIENFSVLHYDIWGRPLEGVRNMFYLGFLFHLFVAFFALNLTLMILFLIRNQVKVWHLVLLLIFNMLIYIGANGRLAYGLSLLAIFSFWLFTADVSKFVMRYAKYIFCILIGIFPLCLIGSVLMTYGFNPEIGWMVKLNEVLGNRLSLATNGLNQFGITWFGQRIEMFGSGLDLEGSIVVETYNWVDNAWMNLLYRYGIVFVVSLCTGYTVLMYTLWKCEEYRTMVLLIIIALEMLIDDCNVFFFFNTFLLMLGNVFRKINMSDKAIETMTSQLSECMVE